MRSQSGLKTRYTRIPWQAVVVAAALLGVVIVLGQAVRSASAATLGPLYEVPYWQEGQSDEPPHWTLLSATGFGQEGLEDVETRYGLWAWHDTQNGELVIQGYEQKIVWSTPTPTVIKTPLEKHRFGNNQLLDADVFIQLLPDHHSQQIVFAMGAEWYRATTFTPMQVFPHLSERPRVSISIDDKANVIFLDS